MKKSAIFFSLLSWLSVHAQELPFIGRWDMTIDNGGKEAPGWLEIKKSGNKTLVGHVMVFVGSARPVSHVKVENQKFSFAIPVQWESGDKDMYFEGESVSADALKGIIRNDNNGKTYTWTAMRAPTLQRTGKITWDKSEKLFNGKDLTGWKAKGENQWIVENGVLKSPKSGSDLYTEKVFNDFKFHIEFKYPKGSNSGVYLRGRYEVQIMDSKGELPTNEIYSGVYGLVEPVVMAAKEAGEWQSYDITLIGRRVTIVANGITVVNDQIIPGITGGAIDSREGEPGPILIQGDHGPIEYRNIVITPGKTN